MSFFKKLKVLTFFDIIGRFRHILRKHLFILRFNAQISRHKIIKNNFKILKLENPDLKPTHLGDLSKYEILSETIILNDFNFEKPKDIFWFQCNISDYKDIKVVWEINRMQFLQPLALNYHFSNDKKTLLLIEKILGDWVSKNTFDIGINYASNLEVAIRALSLFIVNELVGNSLIKEIDIDKLIFMHGLHVYREIPTSALTIRNNHSLGEACVLYLLGRKYEQKRWISRARKIINRFSHLIDKFGDCIEESSNYHLFVTQMLIIANSADDKGELNLSKIISKSIASLKSLSDVNGDIVLFGDCDNGLFYNFYGDTKININKLSLDLFGFKPFETNYVKTGYNKLVNLFEGDKYKIILLTGPERFHAHSHCLSFILLYNGKVIICDPGTYVYNGEPSWREYFRSSYAHNCPTVNKQDHSEQATNFRLCSKRNKVYSIVNERMIVSEFISKKHRLKRTIEFSENSITIKDTSNSCDISEKILFSPGCEVFENGNQTYSIDNQIKIIVDPKVDSSLQDGPLSPSYGVLCKTKNLDLLTKSNSISYIIRME